VAQSEALFETTAFEFTNAELAVLVNETEIATLSALVLEYIDSMPQTADFLTDSFKVFLVYENLAKPKGFGNRLMRHFFNFRLNSRYFKNEYNGSWE